MGCTSGTRSPGIERIVDCFAYFAGREYLAEDGSLGTCDLDGGDSLSGHGDGLSSAAL